MSFYECPKCGGIPGVTFCCTSIDQKQASKVTMPEPVAVWKRNCGYKNATNSPVTLTEGETFITTTQAEAYAAAKVREAQQWISVEDRLPETNQGISGWARVLAYWNTSDPDYEPGGIETSFFDGRNWQGANGEMDYHGARRVTHWMPLPAPPTDTRPGQP